MDLTISLAQMHIQHGSPPDNLAQAENWISEATRRGSQVILFPELWTTGYDLENAQELASTNQSILPKLARLSQQHQIIIGGSQLLKQAGQIFNTFVWHSPLESEPVLYQKIHLFRLMEEDRWLQAGEHLQEVNAPWGRAGLAVCYDLRFPEMFRRYALSGAELIMICAEWPLKRIFHWQTLLRARAIENQFFVAATNCVGECGGEVFGGHSTVVSPWGETLAEGKSDEPELLTATIDLTQVAEVRRHIPIFKDRRPELYE